MKLSPKMHQPHPETTGFHRLSQTESSILHAQEFLPTKIPFVKILELTEAPCNGTQAAIPASVISAESRSMAV